MVGTATEVSERAGRELRHLGWHGRAGPGRHEEKWVARESATVVPLSTSKRMRLWLRSRNREKWEPNRF